LTEVSNLTAYTFKSRTLYTSPLLLIHWHTGAPKEDWSHVVLALCYREPAQRTHNGSVGFSWGPSHTWKDLWI